MDGKLKMSRFFIFEIKHTKMDKIFNFLKDCFLRNEWPYDMIFGVFSEIDVRLVKNINSQFISKYSMCYNILSIKRCLKPNSP